MLTTVVSAVGDATSVRLLGARRVFTLPAAVPEESYTIKAVFPDWGEVTAGKITVSGRDPLVLRCLSDTTTCTAR